MAADLVENPTIEHTFVHDLESAFYVVFWLSIRFLPNSWSSQQRALILDMVFNPPAFENVGASSKRDWMAAMATMVKNDFSVLGNPPLSTLISSLLSLFSTRHFSSKMNDVPPTDEITFGLPSSSPFLVDTHILDQYRAKLADHTGIISMFKESLEVTTMTWPMDDSATMQTIDILDPTMRYSSRSKRSKSFFGNDTEGSSTKKRRR
jgi:hypothetical protein